MTLLQATQQVITSTTWTPDAVIRVIMEVGVIIGLIITYLKTRDAKETAKVADVKTEALQNTVASQDARIGRVSEVASAALAASPAQPVHPQPWVQTPEAFTTTPPDPK